MVKKSELPKNYVAAFKPYDIRGIYPDEINEEVAYRSGRAFAKLFKPKKVVVGCDMRVSSPTLKKAVIKGLTEQGVNVWDIGEYASSLFCLRQI
jgi:phosphomannomutase